jgi:hypothetical protein
VGRTKAGGTNPEGQRERGRGRRAARTRAGIRGSERDAADLRRRTPRGRGTAHRPAHLRAGVVVQHARARQPQLPGADVDGEDARHVGDRVAEAVAHVLDVRRGVDVVEHRLVRRRRGAIEHAEDGARRRRVGEVEGLEGQPRRHGDALQRGRGEGARGAARLRQPADHVVAGAALHAALLAGRQPRARLAVVITVAPRLRAGGQSVGERGRRGEALRVG